MLRSRLHFCCPFFLNATSPTESYTLSLHDALPIFRPGHRVTVLERDVVADVSQQQAGRAQVGELGRVARNVDDEQKTRHEDRKSTRLNSSHQIISYAVFCLKKKNNIY